jgi:hypothetical protein
MEVLRHDGGDCRIELDHDVLFGLERQSLALADLLLTPSHGYAAAHYVPRYGLDPGRLMVSRPPKQAPAVAPPSPAGARRNILFVGRLCHVKGADQFVRAVDRLFARRPDLPHQVEMLGFDGDLGPGGLPYGDFLRSLAGPVLLERLHLPGHQSPDAVAAAVARADFAVFPNRVESFCYAAHEAYDAGVPVIVNDLPAFRDFFVDGRNALVYDGTTDGLVRAMERLLDDEALRGRLRRPHAVGEEGLGDVYRRFGRRARSVRDPAHAVRAVAVVLDQVEADGPALQSLARQTRPPADVVCLRPATPAAGAETFWWLGRPWQARDAGARVRASHDLRTADALLVLQANDRLDDDWLERASRMLARRTELSFAGSWWRVAGAGVTSLLDLAPERFPFEHGAAAARVLVRTDAGRALADLFDDGVGALGETAYLWSAVARWGPGCLWPDAAVDMSPGVPVVDVEALKVLVLRHAHRLGERRSMQLAAVVDQLRLLAQADETVPLLPGSGPEAVDARREQAALRLGGRRLLGLALARAAGRWWSGRNRA